MNIHPIDNRYNVKGIEKFLGEKARLRYQLRVETAYMKALLELGRTSTISAVKELCNNYKEKINIENISIERVKEIEKEIGHDVRALVRGIKETLSINSKRLVHLGLTSYDVVDTARSLQIREITNEMILPVIDELMRELIELARKEARTVQIGRTHGQHAEPITFGHFIANYINRIGEIRERILKESKLPGKITGAVGTKATFELLGIRGDEIEKKTLENLGMEAARITTQIIPREVYSQYFIQIMFYFKVLQNLSQDLWILGMTEINEIKEATSDKQVGSSTMSHKKNPVGIENTESQSKAGIRNLSGIIENIVSRLQRDLSNSAIERYYTPEVFSILIYETKRMKGIISNLVINREKMRENIEITRGQILSEPAYVLMDAYGIVEDSHEYVRKLSRKAEKEGRPFNEILMQDEKFRQIYKQLSPKIQEIFRDPSKYVGNAIEQVERVVMYWERKIR